MSMQATRSQRGRGLGFKSLTLDQLADRLPTNEDKRPRKDRLDRDDRAYRWAVRSAHGHRSRRYHTTLAQAARGMGYPVSADRDDTVSRYGNNVRRALDSLQGAGVLAWGPVKRPDGRFWCLWVELAPGPPACPHARTRGPRDPFPRRRPLLDRAAPRRPSSCTRRIYFSRGQSVNSLREAPLGPRNGGDADARARSARGSPGSPGSPPAAPARPSTHQRRKRSFPDDTKRRAEASRRGAGEHRRSAAVADSLAQLVDAFERAYGAPAHFSRRRWSARLDRVLRRLDRYADFGAGRVGAGLDFALQLIASDAADRRMPAGGWWPDTPPPASLAYYVPILDAVSKDWRRAHKPRRRKRRAAERAANRKGAG